MKSNNTLSKKTYQSLLRIFITLLLTAIGTNSMGAARFAVTGGAWTGAIWATTSGGVAGSAATPTSADDVTINAGVAVSITANAAANTVTFGSGASASITITSNFLLAVTSNVTINAAGSNNTTNQISVGSGTVTIGGNLDITGGNTGGNFKIGLLSIGTGTVTLTGNLTTSTNHVNAQIVFSGAGTFNIAGNWSMGSATTFTPSTGTVNFNGITQVISNSNTFNNITISNSGNTVTIGATTTISGALTVKAGTTFANGGFALGTPTSVVLECGAITGSIISGSGILTLGGNVTVNNIATGTSGATVSCPVALTNVTTRTFTLADDGSSATDLTLSGIISTTGALTKAGAGTMVLSASNTYTGLTTISAGILKLGTAGGVTNTPLGTTGAGTTVSATGAALDLNGFTLGTAEVLTLNGTGVSSGGALTNSSGTASTYSGLITLGSASSIVASPGNILLTAAGTITGATFGLILDGTATGCSLASIIGTTTGALTKNGTGTWTLSGASTYTGATTVNGGTLKAGVATSAFGSASAVSLANTANVVLDITGFSNTIGSLTGGGATGGNVTLGAATLTIGSDNTSPAVYAGIISGTGAVTKSGTGTLIFSGSNSYSGLTTITAGIIKLGAAGGGSNTPLGTTAAGTTVSATGAALDLAGFTLGTAEALTLNGTGVSNGGALTNSSATAVTYSGLLTLGSASSIVSSSGNIVISNVGTISGATFGLTLDGTAIGSSIASIIGTTTGTLTKSGSGTWTLSGVNTYTGLTTLSAGTLKAGVNLPMQTVSITSGVFDCSTFSSTATTLSLNSLGQNAGTYGSTASAATFQNNTYFTAASTGILTVSSSSCNAGNWTGVTSIDWNTASNWCGNVLPTSATDVVIPSGTPFPPTIASGTTATCKNITINASATLTMANSATSILNVNGNFTNNGTFTSGNAGIVNFAGTTQSIAGTSTTTFRNITIKSTSTTTGNVSFIVSASGTFTIENSGTYKHNNNLAYGGSILQGTESFGASSNFEINSTNTTGPSGTVFGNLIINFTTDPGGAVNAASGITTINGTLTVKSTLTREFRLTANTALTATIGAIDVQGGTLNLVSGFGNTYSFTINGNVSISGGILNTNSSGSTPSSPTVNILGDVSITSTGTLISSGAGLATVNFSKSSGTQLFSSTAGGVNTNQFNWNVGTGLTTNIVQLSTDFSMGTNSVMAVLAGSSLDCGTNKVNGTTTTFTLNSLGTLLMGSPLGITSAVATATGNIQTTTARTFSTGANYNYTGTATQITGTGLPATVNTLKINNSGGTTGVTITNSVTATTLDLISGLLTTGGNAVTITSGGSISNASASSYVSGNLKQIFTGTGTKIYPVGKGNNTYRPLTFQYVSLTGTPSTVSVEQFESTLPGTAPAGTNISSTRYWDISQTTGTSFTYNVSLDSTGYTRTGPVVMLKKENGTISSNPATSSLALWTNTSAFNIITPLATSTVSFALGSDCNQTAIAGSNQTGSGTCGLTVVTLGATAPAYGTGAWSIQSGTTGTFSNAASATSTFTGTAGASSVLKWTITNGNCNSNATVNITFNQNPTTSSNGGNKTACQGSTSPALGGNNPSVGTGAWTCTTAPGGGSTGDITFTSASTGNTTAIVAGGAIPGAYALVWTISNSPCTASSSSLTLTVNQIPTTSTNGGNKIACVGTTTAGLGGNTPSVGTGTWSCTTAPGGGSTGDITFTSASTGNTTAIVAGGAVAGAYTLVWTISNSPCTASTSSLTLTVSGTPTTSTNGGNKTACQGSTSAALGGNIPSVGTGVWTCTVAPGGGSTGDITFTSASTANTTAIVAGGALAGAYTLVWTISNSPCTASTSSLTLTVSGTPTSSSNGGNLSACVGTTTAGLGGNTPSVGTGTWSCTTAPGGGSTGDITFTSASTGNTTAIVAGGAVAGAYTLVWSISNSPCTASTSSLTLTVSGTPTTSTNGGNKTACQGSTSSALGGNNPSVGAGVWTCTAAPGGGSTGDITFTSASTANTTAIVAGGSVAGAYTLVWTISNSPCTASTSSLTLTVSGTPTSSSNGGNLSACVGTTTAGLGGNTPSVGTGTWSCTTAPGGGNTGDITFTSASTGNTTAIVAGGAVAGAYTLVWTISNSPCTASTSSLTLTVNGTPTISNAGPDQTDINTCGLSNVTLTANTPIVGTGLWSIISGSGGTFGNSSNPASGFTGVAGNTYTLRWTISIAPCSDSFDEMVVTFNLEPSASNAGTNQNFCLGTTATLAANTPSIGTGAWSVVSGPNTNNSQFNNTSNPAAIFTPAGGLGAYVLAWTISNAPCLPSVSNVTVTAIAGPWIGSVSSDWFDAANWCGGVPTSSIDVTISNGAAFYPIITTGSALAHSIAISSSGSLSINGGDLTGGAITCNGNLNVGSGGTLIMNSSQIDGSGDITIDGIFKTSKAAGFYATTNTAISTTVSSVTLGSSSTIDYTSGGSQTITEANYANLSNNGNGDRTLFNSGTIGVSAVFSPGSGDYTLGTSTVEFNGTGAQNIPAMAPDSKYNNLIINNSGSGVSMVADLNLIDALTLTDGAFTTTGFNFTLLSTATQTARIAPITGGSITGNVTMQRFVPGGTAGWATVGMPVGGRTLADWNDDIITTGFNGSSTGTGTFINIYTYDESIGGNADDAAAYIPATDITNSVDPKRGYYIFIADNATVVADKLIDVSGPPLTGNQNMNVTYTNNTNVNEDGWNLINNPYCSAIDWTSPDWTKTNMDDAIYIYDADNAQYTGYVNGMSFNGGNEIIGSSQAFLVHSNLAGPSLIAKENVKAAGSPTFYRSASTTTVAGVLRLQLDGLGGTYNDESIFRTKTGATPNFDPAYDAYKLYSFDPAAPNISTKMNGIEYVVNSVEELSNNLDLPVKVNVITPGSYTINFKGLANFSNVNCLTFEDKLTGISVNLHTDSSYTFTSAIDTVVAYNRFVLHFGLDALVASIAPSATSVSLPGNTTVSFTNSSTGASSYTWDFGDGSPVEITQNPSHTYTTAGVYTVTFTASNTAGCSGPQTVTVQITVDDVTGITTSTAAESINIIKDVQGIYADYNFKNSTKVKVTIYNAIGEQIGNTQNNTVQSKGKFLIKAPEMAKGIYTIELLFNNKKINRKIEF